MFYTFDMNKKDKCVICGQDSPYSIDTPIYNRYGYIEGAGQGCATNEDTCENKLIVRNKQIHLIKT